MSHHGGKGKRFPSQQSDRQVSPSTSPRGNRGPRGRGSPRGRGNGRRGRLRGRLRSSSQTSPRSSRQVSPQFIPQLNPQENVQESLLYNLQSNEKYYHLQDHPFHNQNFDHKDSYYSPSFSPYPIEDAVASATHLPKSTQATTVTQSQSASQQKTPQGVSPPIDLYSRCLVPGDPRLLLVLVLAAHGIDHKNMEFGKMALLSRHAFEDRLRIDDPVPLMVWYLHLAMQFRNAYDFHHGSPFERLKSQDPSSPRPLPSSEAEPRFRHDLSDHRSTGNGGNQTEQAGVKRDDNGKKVRSHHEANKQHNRSIEAWRGSVPTHRQSHFTKSVDGRLIVHSASPRPFSQPERFDQSMQPEQDSHSTQHNLNVQLGVQAQSAPPTLSVQTTMANLSVQANNQSGQSDQLAQDEHSKLPDLNGQSGNQSGQVGERLDQTTQTDLSRRPSNELVSVSSHLSDLSHQQSIQLARLVSSPPDLPYQQSIEFVQYWNNQSDLGHQPNNRSGQIDERSDQDTQSDLRQQSNQLYRVQSCPPNLPGQQSVRLVQSVVKLSPRTSFDLQVSVQTLPSFLNLGNGASPAAGG